MVRSSRRERKGWIQADGAAQSNGESLLLYRSSFTLSHLQKQEKCVSCVAETAKSEPTMQWYTPEVALLSAGGYLASKLCLT
mmetsp:Transcript_16461/g.39434  ORF Transcript_16461/g.39434 Transcript_16461/m.39434 type:complete len:82 (+) Transcript_16461:205-450(+)